MTSMHLSTLEATLLAAIESAIKAGYTICDCGDYWINTSGNMRQCSAIGALVLSTMQGVVGGKSVANTDAVRACLVTHGLSTLNAVAIDDGYDGRMYGSNDAFNYLGARLRPLPSTLT